MMELKQFCAYCRNETQNKDYHEDCLKVIVDSAAEELSNINFENTFPAPKESFHNQLYADIFELEKRYTYCDYCGKRSMQKGITTYECGHNYCKIKAKKSCRVVAVFFENRCIFCTT